MEKKILIIDAHEVVRVGLALIINNHRGFTVVGRAKNSSEAMDIMQDELPDIVLMDITLHDENGIDLCRDIIKAYPMTKVLILTSVNDDELIMQSIMAGASGYLLKEIGNEELLTALEKVAAGGTLLDPATTARVLNLMKNMVDGRRTDSLREKFNDQEYKILALLGEGKTNNEIGEILHLSPKTIKNYVSNLLSKLEMHNRAEAAVFAVKNNIKMTY